MTPVIGELCLSAGVLTSAAAIFMAASVIRFHDERLLRAVRALVGLLALLFTVATISLAYALVTSDFRLEYVASYSERAMPLGYKIAAVWAGQEGSLLLWGWFIALAGAAGLAGFKRLSREETAISGATIAAVGGFFAALMLFAANPFDVFTGGVPSDGRGLNPMLQDPGMVIHPPLLFLGYSGFTVPFAVLIGVLFTGRTDNRWLADIRRWLLVSWMFLTAGIVVGAWWAYVELGWGGYWAWDPVENASLLPWLTGTALLHNVVIHQHRGMFKAWTAALTSSTFTLCIFGTYLTRSGVIDSVHAFAPSLVGTFFLAFLGVLLVASVSLIVWRRRRLATEAEMESVVSREGAFFLGNIILVVMTLTTLIGTTWPILSSAVGGEAVTVKPSFYNSVVAPMAILLVALMAMGPVLAFGKSAPMKIARSLLVPGVLAMLMTGIAAVWITSNAWALVCIGITALGTFTVIVDFIRVVGARARSTGEALASAAVRVVDRDHRRYGGQIAHLGVMLIVIGVAASSLFSLEETFSLRRGESATLGSVTIRLASLENRRAPNHSAVEANIELLRDGVVLDVLRPQIRLYEAWGNEPNTEVAIRSHWNRDVYVSIAGWDNAGEVTAIQLRLNPGVLWIWIGGGVMVAGALVSLAPRALSRAWTWRPAREHRHGADTQPARAKPELVARSSNMETAP